MPYSVHVLQLRAMRVMVANDILKDAQVICATCVGAGELARLLSSLARLSWKGTLRFDERS